MEIEVKDHQEVAEPDGMVSGTAGTGQENEELRWMRKYTAASDTLAEQVSGPGDNAKYGKEPAHPRAKPAERRTGNRRQATGSAPGLKQPVQDQTERDLPEKDPDIPPCAAGRANRGMACPFIREQDEVNEWLLGLINELEYRIDEIEYVRGAIYRKRHTSGTVVEK